MLTLAQTCPTAADGLRVSATLKRGRLVAGVVSTARPAISKLATSRANCAEGICHQCWYLGALGGDAVGGGVQGRFQPRNLFHALDLGKNIGLDAAKPLPIGKLGLFGKQRGASRRTGPGGKGVLPVFQRQRPDRSTPDADRYQQARQVQRQDLHGVA